MGMAGGAAAKKPAAAGVDRARGRGGAIDGLLSIEETMASAAVG